MPTLIEAALPPRRRAATRAQEGGHCLCRGEDEGFAPSLATVWCVNSSGCAVAVLFKVQFLPGRQYLALEDFGMAKQRLDWETSG